MPSTSVDELYDLAETGVERAEEWKPSDKDPLRVGRVEGWKLIRPKDRPHEPVWLIEARNREGGLWSKFVGEKALQVKLIGRSLDRNEVTAEEIMALDADEFPAAAGTFVAIKFEGKVPHPENPAWSVTRWTTNIVA
jgi:hypothetical protein